jgi:hypothetical protein
MPYRNSVRLLLIHVLEERFHTTNYRLGRHFTHRKSLLVGVVMIERMPKTGTDHDRRGVHRRERQKVGVSHWKSCGMRWTQIRFNKGERGESQAFGADVVLSDEAVMFENQQLTVPTPDFLTLSQMSGCDSNWTKNNVSASRWE